MDQKAFQSHLVSLTLFIVFNILVGSYAIQLAQQSNYAATIQCNSNNCAAAIGIDFTVLFISMLVLSLFTGFHARRRNKSFPYLLFMSPAIIGSVLLLVEIFVMMSNSTVLYTDLVEGKQTVQSSLFFYLGFLSPYIWVILLASNFLFTMIGFMLNEFGKSTGKLILNLQGR